MDFGLGRRVEELRDHLRGFMDEHVYPVEAEAIQAIDDEVAPGIPYPQILIETRAKAREAGLWNLFMPDERYGAGLANWEYGVLCEEMGRSPLVAPMVFNCAAPDTGNIEVLAQYATQDQTERWLEPLLGGAIRSTFAMTEPEVAGSDPTTLATTATPSRHRRGRTLDRSSCCRRTSRLRKRSLGCGARPRSTASRILRGTPRVGTATGRP